MKSTTFITVILLFVLSASACAPKDIPAVGDGQIVGIQARTALWIIKQSVDGAPGTFIMAKDNMYAMFSPANGGMYFVVVDTAKQTAIQSLQEVIDCGGNYANCKTFAQLFDALIKNGWTKALPASLPKVFYTAVSKTPAAWLMGLANSMPTFVLAPAVMLDSPSVLETIYPQVEQ